MFSLNTRQTFSPAGKGFWAEFNSDRNRADREKRQLYMKKESEFERITPDILIHAVEKAVGFLLTGFISPMPSYVNRVYEFQTKDGARLIGKFYRPGRWSKEALEEEHGFIEDCARDEIPVISPMKLIDGSTIGIVENIHFAVFPKRFGREFDITEDEDWRRLGRIIARIHNAGSRKKANNRVRLHPHISTTQDIRQLLEGGFVSSKHENAFQKVGQSIVDFSADLFHDVEFIRLHGDCHRGNLLYRPGEGIMVIDFDDMMVGPPVQDLWLLLPDYSDKCKKELGLILEGYELFRNFDRKTLRLIEALRAMRIIYFLAWCSRQANDFKFKNNFPEWGSDAFWQQEINDLARQLQRINQQPDR